MSKQSSSYKRKRREALRKWRAEHPIEYAYQTTKDNAKRRGKYFDLTLEQFKKFCRKNDYIGKKGKTRESLSIDCIENEEGYTAKNIRALPLGENSSKGTKVLSYDWRTRTATVYQVEVNNDFQF